MKPRTRKTSESTNLTWSLAASVVFHVLVVALCATTSVFYPLTGHAEKFEFIWLAAGSLPDAPDLSVPLPAANSTSGENGSEHYQYPPPEVPAENDSDHEPSQPPEDTDTVTLVAAADKTPLPPDNRAGNALSQAPVQPRKSSQLPEENDRTNPPEKQLVAATRNNLRRDEEAERAREEAERKAVEQTAQEQRAREELNAKKLEQERLDAERAERERIAREQVERDRLAEQNERERKAAVHKAELDQQAREKVRQERLAAEQAERERIAREQAERDRLAAEQAERERKAAAHRAALEQQAREKARQERLAAERTERDRIAREQAERERLAAEQAEREREAAAHRAALEQQAREKARQERLAAERTERDRIAREQKERDRLAADQAERERKAAAHKAALEQQAREKERQERLAAERADRERIAREQKERDRLAADQAERERKAAAHRAALEQQAREKARQERLAAERLRVAANNRTVDQPAQKPAPRADVTGTPATAATTRQAISERPQDREKPQASKVAPEAAQPILPPVYGDLKMVVQTEKELKISILFREFPQARRSRPMSRSEAARTRKVEPLILKTLNNSREVIVKTTGQGVYLFLAEPDAGETDRGAFTLKIFESTAGARVKTIGNRTIAGKTVIARVLMPEGILWEDDSAFSGSYEDSDSTTKFNTDTGLAWKEYKN